MELLAEELSTYPEDPPPVLLSVPGVLELDADAVPAIAVPSRVRNAMGSSIFTGIGL